MTLYNVLKPFHVIAAVFFAGGLFARQAVRAYATSTDDVVWFAPVMKAAAHIERRMVRPGSLAVLALGIVQARLGGIPIFGSLTGGNQNWLLVSMSLYVGTFALVPLVFLPRGRSFRPALAAALEQGRMTPELRAAMNDPVVALAHRFEEASTLVVFALMVLKSF
jgi:uncharacterized membrane protein